MNARSHYTPESREPANEHRRYSSGSSVAMGACLCGTVHYAVDRPLETLSQYSDPGRSSHGEAEAIAVLVAPLVAFRWVAGEEWLTSYDSAEGTRRSFCRWCGSAMPVTAAGSEAMLCPVSSLRIPVAQLRAPQPMPA